MSKSHHAYLPTPDDWKETAKVDSVVITDLVGNFQVIIRTATDERTIYEGNDDHMATALAVYAVQWFIAPGGLIDETTSPTEGKGVDLDHYTDDEIRQMLDPGHPD